MKFAVMIYWLLVAPLLWPRLAAADTLKAEKVAHATRSHARGKRAWVWNQFSVTEEMDPPIRIGRLRSDLDTGNSSFQYELLGTGAGRFSIDESTGVLYTARKLDREERSFYTLRAQVIDTTTGKAVEPESEFVIRVLDINDNEPKFLDGPYEAVVPEMSPEGTFVKQVTAADADDPVSGYNARLLYSLTKGQAYFSVEPTTGVIRISSEMDRELQDEYLVIIQARDMIGQPGALSASASVLIKLSDINDNKPRFKESFYRFTVSESAPPGTMIGTILAFDEDIGENAEMDYSLEEDDSHTFDIITDNDTQEGIIILKKKVDFERHSHYGFRAQVRNRHVEEHLKSKHAEASTTFIKVQVEDEDEPPVFLLPYYVFDIDEGRPPGSFVGTVSAVDPDQRDSPIRYSLSRSKVFHIHGNGTISTTELLDREVTAWYNLSVTATEIDNTQQISSVPVYVQVLNINDHAPQLSPYYGNAYVCENAKSGQIIHTITAIDKDESIEDEHFSFNLSVEDTSNSSFTLTDNQDNTAVIVANKTGFYLEEEPVFYLIILIADNGTPPLTSTNTLTISVCDCGDNGSTELCASRGLTVGIKIEVVIAVLTCIMVLLGLLFLLVVLKQQRDKQTLFPEKGEDFGENIFRYDDEGGGEEDTEAFDIAELGSPTVMRERKTRRTTRADIRSLYRQSLQVGPDSAIFRKFILEKLEEANTDPSAPPFDSLQTFAFEGTGSLAGSLSSLGSAVLDQEDNFDYLNELGPRFKRLAFMFGSAKQSKN